MSHLNFRNINRLIRRYKNGQDSLREFFLRGFFLPNRIRYKESDIFWKNWNCLIVLDACRYDYFKRFSTFNGELEEVYSCGTHTVEWLLSNFSNEKKYDLIYVSGNPRISPLELKERFGTSEKFFKLVNVWDFGWDGELGTVHPKEVVKSALEQSREYPEKRKIIHFVQPHSPFIGEPNLILDEYKEGRTEGFINWRDLVKSGKISLNKVKESYIGNLKLVLRHVEDLIKELNGEVVITADHGEAFGEYGIFSHPPAMYIPELLRVPWFRVDNDIH